MGIFSKVLQSYIKNKGLDTGIKCNICGGEMVNDYAEGKYWCPDCDNTADVTSSGIRYNWDEDDENDEYTFFNIFSQPLCEDDDDDDDEF